MKVLIATTYLYNPEWPEFTRNKTGFGIMLKDIVFSVSKYAEVQFITHVITEGHGKIIRKHTWQDVVYSVKLKDIVSGGISFFRYPDSLLGRAKNSYYFINKGFVRKTIKDFKPDIVHIHGIGHSLIPYIEVCEELHVPYIVTLHGLIGLDESIQAPIWEKEIEKNFLIEADQKAIPVTVISTGMKRRIEKNYLHHEAKNIYVVCNGTRIPVHNEVVGSERIDLRKQFKLKDHEKIVVAIGSVCERKNQIQIVRAMSQKAIHTPCRLFLCGTENTNGAVQKEIQKLGLQGVVHLLGFVPQHKIAQILEQADLNVVASKDEGFGLSIIEAYSHGVPTVMFSDLDAFPDLFNENTMVRVDERDDSALAEGIEKALLRKWDHSVITHFGRKFSLAHMAEQYLLEYKRKIVRGGTCP